MAGNGAAVVDPASVRSRLAEAAAESVEDIRRVLLETATGALRATVVCKHCARAGRYEIAVPDSKVRLDAVQALLHEALGRPGQAVPRHRRRFRGRSSRFAPCRGTS